MPGITPHRAGLPGSVWDLTYPAWLKLVATARAYRNEQQAQQRAARSGQGARRRRG